MTDSIVLQGVTKTFGTQKAVDDLDLVVPEGSIYGFIGPNGSGKTTTIRMILRIFQPDCGMVRVLGNELGSVADDRVGYLPEERGMYKRMKVRDLLTYYSRLKGFYNCRDEIQKWLDRLGAADWGKKRIDTLSKGMAQKVQFIAAVVARPQLVILDEPFSGLDPLNLEVLQDAVLQLRKNGSTIIFSTHDMHVAERLCDTIFMVFQGRKVLDGTLENIQREFMSNILRIRLANEHSEPPRMNGVDAVRAGRYWELSSNRGDSQSVLRELAHSDVEVDHFEKVRPTLHDIFVRVAQPEDVPEKDAQAGVGGRFEHRSTEKG